MKQLTPIVAAVEIVGLSPHDRVGVVIASAQCKVGKTQDEPATYAFMEDVTLTIELSADAAAVVLNVPDGNSSEVPIVVNLKRIGALSPGDTVTLAASSPGALGSRYIGPCVIDCVQSCAVPAGETLMRVPMPMDLWSGVVVCPFAGCAGAFLRTPTVVPEADDPEIVAQEWSCAWCGVGPFTYDIGPGGWYEHWVRCSRNKRFVHDSGEPKAPNISDVAQDKRPCR